MSSASFQNYLLDGKILCEVILTWTHCTLFSTRYSYSKGRSTLLSLSFTPVCFVDKWISKNKMAQNSVTINILMQCIRY